MELKEAWKIADLAKHYIAQLLQAGWTQIDEEQTEHAAWSTWTFSDKDNEEWLATLYLFQLAGEQIRYHLSLRADWKNPPQPKNGWFAYSS